MQALNPTPPLIGVYMPSLPALAVTTRTRFTPTGGCLRQGRLLPPIWIGMLYLSSHPSDAGRLAEAQFHQNESMFALQAALRHYTEARAWGRIEALLSSLDPDQRSVFQNSSVLLATRATYLFKIGRPDAGLADLRRSVQSPEAGEDIRIAYLWGLVAFGTDDELRLATYKWRDAPKQKVAYWGVFAAAGLRWIIRPWLYSICADSAPRCKMIRLGCSRWLMPRRRRDIHDRSRQIRLEAEAFAAR